jgi:pyrimidine-specific ribonucleoside hydrolase
MKPSLNPQKKPFFFDMETSDPDDIFALALLCTHPRTELVGVTIHPGGMDQVGVVRHVLDCLGKPEVPIGVSDRRLTEKSRVSSFHYDWLGAIGPQVPEWTAYDLIQSTVRAHKDCHLVTGAALTNVAQSYGPVAWFPYWTCQGGFAGDNIVPQELRLSKFEGRDTCPTFNLNGDPKAAKKLLCETLPNTKRWMVSKNVCHGVLWDQTFHDLVPQGAHPGLDLILKGMNHYFKKSPLGKALHDVIAVVAAIDPSVGSWTRVKPYRDKNGEWGCLSSNDNQDPEIMIALDREKFLNTLAE